ncbi:MAG: SufD family Fe-S cluster assembly protein [bacterium]|nr:SufD family Fe-S cluster assembly protein [bacterium]
MQSVQNTLNQGEKKQFVYSWFGEENREESNVITLEGDNSEVDVYGIFYGRDSSTLKNSVKIVHKGRNTRANVFACGVVVDRSFLDFSGMLRVEHGAKGTRTFFRANLMILSPKSSAYTFPGLEIEENDITQGGHAATIGKVNEEQMFYLMSRGLGENEAKKIVIHGFFEPVLSQINNADQAILRKKLSGILD